MRLGKAGVLSLLLTAWAGAVSGGGDPVVEIEVVGLVSLSEAAVVYYLGLEGTRANPARSIGCCALLGS